MTPAESYRALAEAERDAAAKEVLPSRRAVHERSAEAWEEMAERAEDTVEKASVNAAANRRW
ncbi:MAG: hypothetical protein ABIP41_03305 [Croceibacterium sp.]